MNTILAPFFAWLLRTSWQASVLTAVILATQWVFRKKLGAQWRYALWLLVVARLLLPSSLPSPISLFNYVQVKRDTPAVNNEFLNAASLRPVAKGHPAAEAGRSFLRTEQALELGTLIWLGGALLFAVRIFGPHFRFRRLLVDSSCHRDSATQALCQCCTSEMGVTADIRLTETRLVKSPAVLGVFRPTILLPAEIIGQFDARELRHIFLHELAHVKRADAIVLWLVTLGRILHWFNPVLWLGFQRMAVDRELACDELALRRIGEAEAAAYGKTILKLVELCDRPVAVPGMAGVLEERGRMRRRIEMIASFKPGRRWSTLGAVLLMVVGLATLTDAQQAATNPARQFDLTLPAVQKPPPDATNSNKPKLTINRIVVDDSGKVFVNNEYVPDAKLKEKVQSLQAADPDLRVVVKGSGDTKYRDMLKVLDVLQKLNVTKIGLATQEETGGVSPHY